MEDGRTGVRFPAEARYYIFIILYRQNLGTTKTPVQWVLEAVSSG
jgi:hypothetical protein